MRPLLPLLAALALAGSALGAHAALFDNGDAPLDIQGGDQSSVNQTTCRYMLTSPSATNPARVSQGTQRLQGRTLTVSGGQVRGQCQYNHAEATGGVFYVAPDITIKADDGTYDQPSGIAVFSSRAPDGLIVVQGLNVTVATKATWDMKAGALTFGGAFRTVIYPSYEAVGANWSLNATPAALTLTRTGAALLSVANPGMVKNGEVLTWTTPALKMTFTPGKCSQDGKTYDYVAQVTLSTASYSGCGGRKGGA